MTLRRTATLVGGGNMLQGASELVCIGQEVLGVLECPGCSKPTRQPREQFGTIEDRGEARLSLLPQVASLAERPLSILLSFHLHSLFLPTSISEGAMSNMVTNQDRCYKRRSADVGGLHLATGSNGHGQGWIGYSGELQCVPSHS